jgi:hypothetical protein
MVWEARDGIVEERDRFVVAADVAERTPELEERLRDELVAQSERERALVVRDRLVGAPGGVVLAADLVLPLGLVHGPRLLPCLRSSRCRASPRPATPRPRVRAPARRYGRSVDRCDPPIGFASPPSPTTSRRASRPTRSTTMTKVYTGASMSLDGYISGPAETGFEHLFKWYGNGDVVVPTTHPEMTLRMSAVSAEHFRSIIDNTGALVVGRRLFDSTGAFGW